MDISGSELSLSISVLVGADSQGHFDLSATDCSFHVSDVDVHVHGGTRYIARIPYS